MALPLDSVLFRNAFSTEEMRSIFDEDTYILKFMEVEAALARAEATAGLIPEEAAAEITAHVGLEYLDRDELQRLIAETGIPSMSIIGAWDEQVGDAGEYIHWGATTQDIMDTARVLQLREAYDVVRRDLHAIEDQLAALAEEHKDTPMMGRTHYVHAIPITFGLKVAVWLDELGRHLDRLDELEDRLLVAQFFGATGTLASIGDAGIEVQRHLEDELDLPVPDVVWQPARDRFAEVVNLLAMVASTLSKIANQVLVLHRPEIREVEETTPEGQIGSSTMPHKKNPRKSESNVAIARLVRTQAHAMNEVMETVDERSASTWYAEFVLIPEVFLFASRLLDNTIALLESLCVHPDRMRQTIDLHGGLVASERVLMTLADELGRQTAHDIVHEDAMRAIDEDRDFTRVLLQDDRVRAHLSAEEIESLTDASDYVGLSARFVDQVLDHRQG